MKETICSILDVMSYTKLKSIEEVKYQQEIDLTYGIIPNEVNGEFHKFKTMMYTIFERLIQFT